MRKGRPPTYSYRMWLAINTMQSTGTDIFTALEAVSSVAIEHPEWDLEKRKTWEEWESYEKGVS